jgi:hypothetical protein
MLPRMRLRPARMAWHSHAVPESANVGTYPYGGVFLLVAPWSNGRHAKQCVFMNRSTMGRLCTEQHLRVATSSLSAERDRDSTYLDAAMHAVKGFNWETTRWYMKRTNLSAGPAHGTNGAVVSYGIVLNRLE